MASRSRRLLLASAVPVAVAILFAATGPVIAATGPVSASARAPISIEITTGNRSFHGYTYAYYPSTETVAGVDPGGVWTVDRIDGSTYLEGISCPSIKLCVASDVAGRVVTSRDPTGGTRDWHAAHIDSSNLIHQVSCTRESTCVAVDSAGQVLTSTDPTGGATAWHAADVDGSNALWGISCPTARMCAASDAAGSVVTSTDSAGGTTAWHAADVDGSNTLYGISCPTSALCVAVDTDGNIVTSTDPSGGVGAWHVTKVDGYSLFNISCASVRLCVAVDNAGEVVTSTNPTGGARAWHFAVVDGNSLYSVSCTLGRLCVGVDDAGGVVASTDPTGGKRAWHFADRDGDHSFYNVSCPTVSLCVAVDTVGHALTSTNPADLVALEESAFPFHKAMAVIATTETDASGHYSFQVRSAVATRFRVVTLGPSKQEYSRVRTVYEVLRVVGSITECASEPTCTVVWIIQYELPKQVVARELAEPFRLYLGVTHGSEKPPKTLLLDRHVKVKTTHLGAGSYTTRFTFTIDVGTGAWRWSANVCQKDIEATDGFNLPGHFPCGAKSVGANAYLPATQAEGEGIRPETAGHAHLAPPSLAPATKH